MNDNPLISVIVPIYNVENYLKRCIESIKAQTYGNLEIILVDDGSTDHSSEICDEYANLDDRIKVIHKKNGGLSEARNYGLDIMSGEYVTCIDSDDFVSPYLVENLFIALVKGNCTISSSWFVEYYDGDALPKQNKISSEDIQVLRRENFYRKMLYQDGVEISAWGKLYKSDLFNGVRYPVGKLYEDVATTYLLLEQAEKIAVIPNVDYYYFQRSNSIAQSEFNIRKMDAIIYMNELREFISDKYPNLTRAAECRYFSTVCNILFQIRKEEFEPQRRQLWSEVKKYRKSILSDKDGRRKTRLAALASYGGPSFTQRMFRLFS